MWKCYKTSGWINLYNFVTVCQAIRQNESLQVRAYDVSFFSIILWSSLNRQELWGFPLSASKGNPTYVRAQISTRAPHVWHALRLLHFVLPSAMHTFPISIHDVNRPANLVMIILVVVFRIFYAVFLQETPWKLVGWLVKFQRLQAVDRFAKQLKTKGIFIFVWLYL